MNPFFVTLSGQEIAIAGVIFFFFLVSIVIALGVRKNPESDEGGLEHFDHEHGEADAR